MTCDEGVKKAPIWNNNRTAEDGCLKASHNYTDCPNSSSPLLSDNRKMLDRIVRRGQEIAVREFSSDRIITVFNYVPKLCEKTPKKELQQAADPQDE